MDDLADFLATRSGQITLCVVLGFVAAVVAYRKGHPFLKWWVMGSLLPIVFLPAAVIVRRRQSELDRREVDYGNAKRCPHCAELVRHEARVCRFCGCDVTTPTLESEADVAPPAEADGPLSQYVRKR